MKSSYDKPAADSTKNGTVLHPAFDRKEFVIGRTPHQSMKWLPVSALSQHGLVVGAQNSGKLSTLQSLCEGLCRTGIPVLATDCSGRLSGLARPGAPSGAPSGGPRSERLNAVCRGYPVVLWDPAGIKGHHFGIYARGFRDYDGGSGDVFDPLAIERLADGRFCLFGSPLTLEDDEQELLADLLESGENGASSTLPYGAALAALAADTSTAAWESEQARAPNQAAISLARKLQSQASIAEDLLSGTPVSLEVLFSRDYVGLGCINLLELAEVIKHPPLYEFLIRDILSGLARMQSEAQGFQSQPRTSRNQPRLVFAIEHAELVFGPEPDENLFDCLRDAGVAVILCTESPADIPAWLIEIPGVRFVHRLPSEDLTASVLPTSEPYHRRTVANLKPETAFVSIADDSARQSQPTLVRIRRPHSQLAELSPEHRAEVIQRSPIRSSAALGERQGRPNQIPSRLAANSRL